MRGNARNQGVIIIVISCSLLLALGGSRPLAAQEQPLTSARLEVPPAGEWGTPPEDDWPVAIPEFPGYEGWYYFLAADSYGGALAADGNTLYVSGNSKLLALDLETGHERWVHQVADEWGNLNDISIGRDAVYYFFNDALYALDIQTGGVRWSRYGSLPLATSPDGIWVTEKIAEWQDPAAGTGLELLDSATGDVVNSYLNTKLQSTTVSAAGQLDYIAVSDGDQILLCRPDGTVEPRPLLRPGWQSVIAPGPRGFLVCEYLDTGILMDDETFNLWTDEGEYSDDYYALLVDPVTGEQGGPMVISYYLLEKDAPEWQITLDSDMLGYFCGTDAGWTADHVYLQVQRSSILINLNDGEVIIDEWSGEGRPGTVVGLRQMPAGNDVALVSVEAWPAVELRRKDLSTGAEATYPTPIFGDLVCLCDGYLAWLYSSTGISGGYENNLALMVFRLDENLALVTGTITAARLPEMFESLGDRFFASAAPLSDNGLMTEVVTSGVNAVGRLLDRAGPGNTAQLDALAVATAYLYEAAGTGRYSMSAMDVLQRRLKQLADPALAGTLLRWLDEASLSELHARLKGVLVNCGPEGCEYLASLAPEGYGGRHVTVDFPVALSAQEAFYTDLGSQAHNVTEWVEAVDETGKRYVVYTASGLMCEQDIYLAVDSDDDGLYEEVLPTGLTDIFQGYSFPGGAYEIDSQAILALQVSGGVVTINHHVPIVLVDEEYGWRYYDETEYEAKELTLEELRADTDGDGLTDITENLLLTDPDQADTDGDGISDREDPAPNVDPAEMGRVERGIARALDYFFNDGPTAGYFAQWWDADASGHPYRAVYYTIEGAGPFAYAGSANTYGICLRNADNSAFFEDHLATFPGFTNMELSFTDMTDLTDEQYEQLFWDKPESGEVEEMIEAMRSSGFPSYQLTIDLTWLGFAVDLVAVDGELYPVDARMTWIS